MASEWIVGIKSKRMTKEEFDKLRDSNPMTGAAIAGELCKFKIDGRWHFGFREYSLGIPFYYATPIVLICPAVVGV